MAAAKIANRLGRLGKANPGRQHLVGADVTARMQRQYEHILTSLRESHRYPSDAKRRQVAAATVRKLAGNPDERAAAERLAERFHGRPAQGEFDVLERETYDQYGSVLGYLVELWILCEDGRHATPIRFPYDTDQPQDNILLISNTKGTNIELVGGDQRILKWQSIEGASTDESKYLAMIGPLYEIVYWADKHHLEGPEKQKSGMEYFHDWEELPFLVFDTRNIRLLLIGGSYTIEPEGITG